MSTLGERLRVIGEHKAIRAQAVADARARAEAEKALQERLAVEGYFRAARDIIERAIDAGRKVPLITLGKMGDDGVNVSQILATFNWNDPARRIDRPAHPYHDVWKTFADWALLEQLLVGWRYDHDGTGFSSWYVLAVEPL